MENKMHASEKRTEVELPEYQAPTVLTYTDEEILDVLGPAQANIYSLANSV